MTEKRVQLSTIVKSQVPEYIRTDFPLITEFLKEYYVGQEYQGGPIDLINNIDQYIKIDSFADRVTSTTLIKSINTTSNIIEINDTAGFPDSYGLIKIDDEIITYTGKTKSSFTGCIRGFSGVCDLTKNNSPDEVLFETTNAQVHKNGAEVLNLSVLFLVEFLNKTKKEIALGFDDREFYSELNENTFLKQVRSFYASKGTEESFKILFKALYGANVKMVKPAEQLFRPSDAQYNKVESLVVEPTLEEDEFANIQNITVFQDFPTKSYAPIAYSEKISTNGDKPYYRLDIDSGYNKDITFNGATYGDFKVTPKTKLINPVSIGSTYFDVESTVGFAKTGNISFLYTDGTIGSVYYGSKTINQFRDIDYIFKEIKEEESITDKDTFAYATINGKRVECNVSSIISKINYPNKSLYNKKDVVSRIKTLGFEGTGFKYNEWFYNNKKIITVALIETIDASDDVYRLTFNNDHFLVREDVVDVIDTTGVEVSATILSVIDSKSVNIRSSSILDVTKKYNVKRKILKGISPAFPQINDYHANVQNVYTDDDNNLLIASSSIPSEPISIADIDLIINGTFEGTEVTFTKKHNFKTGDKVYYYPESTEKRVIDENFNYTTEVVEGTKLFDAGIYYVEVTGENSVKFALSKENIFFGKYITFPQTTVSNNTVRLYDFYQNKLLDQKLLREIPVPLENSSEKIKTIPGMTGMLLNGVEVLNYKSKNNIYYGAVKSVDVLVSDNQFDVISPPNLIIEDSQGKNADGYLGITGSLNKIKIIDRGFDYEGTPTIKVVGGNGTGASVLVNMKLTDHVSSFNSRVINLNPTNIIGFSTYHKFRNLEEVVYQTSGQQAIAGLTTNSTYYVGNVDLTSLKLYNTPSDASAGINTVNLTAYGIGVHNLKSVLKKRQIDSVNVVEPGEGYSNRKIVCDHTGISTSRNIINGINHGYTSGDIIQYFGTVNSSDTNLVGLSLNTDYVATVIDNDNFTLSPIGVGNSVSVFADRGEYVNIKDKGTGTHIFNHPPIQVTLSGKTGIGTEFVANLQPQFIGSIDNVYISDGGVGYGATNIQEFERNPIVTYSIGKDTQIKTIVNNGSITEAIPLNRGKDFTSAPNVVVDGDGSGAVLTATLKSDGRIDRIIVIEGGRGYTQNNTTIRVVSPESLSKSKFQPHLQSWKINLFQDNIDRIEKDDGILTKSSFGNYGIQYSHLYAPRYLRSKLIPSDSEGAKKYGSSDLPFNRVEIESPYHSPIIGWAYDGNPIYGPYGYETKSGGIAKRMKSGYYDDTLSRTNRPPNYPSGYFVEDYTYYRVDDDTVLDENNGRYCITPEFPNGVYAYFATVSENADDSGPFRDYKKPIFPYLIGDNYYSIPSKFNQDKNSNQDDYDLNQSNYKRNTSVYNFFDKDIRYPYITLPNDLDQKVTVKTVGKGKVNSTKILAGGDLYKVNDRLVFDQENSGGKGLAAKVSFVEGKEILSLANQTTNNHIEIRPSGKKGVFVGIATTSHGYFDGELITLTSFSTVKSKFEGSYDVNVPATTLTFVGLGTTAFALESVSNTGIVTYAYATNTDFDSIRENDVVQISNEKVKILNIDKTAGRIRIIREFDGSSSAIHTVGTAGTVMQRQFLFNSDYDNSFNFKENKEIYFDPSESVGLSLGYANPGSGTTVVFNNPGTSKTSIYIKPRNIYLKDHNLKTGDAVKYNVNNSGHTAIKYEDNSTSSGVGSDFVSNRTYYVARFDKDHIGIATVIVGIGSTGIFSGIAATTANTGLVDFTNVGTGNYHSFTTQYPKLTATAIQNRVTVSTATTHGLSTGHKILFDVKPRVEKTVVVKYDDFNSNIIINPKSFEPTGINTQTGIITIENHGFSTGDKLIHTSEWSTTAFDNNTAYYAVKIDKDNFKLSSTLYNSQLDQPLTVVGVATTAGTLGPVNPPIDTEGYSRINFDLTDSSLRYIYFQNEYPAFDLDFYLGNTFNKPWTKNPEDADFKVFKTGIVGSTGTVSLFLEDNTPKDLFYNLIPKYTQGVPLQEDKKNVYLDTSVDGAGSLRVSKSSYSGGHKVTVSTASTFTYNLKNSPEVVSYGSTNATLSYITDCTHTDGPIARVEILNTGDNYETLPGFTTITSINGRGADLELQSSDIGKIEKVELTNYGYDFPYDQTIRPLFYYPQSLRITPFSSIDTIGISSFGRGYSGEQELVVIDGVNGNVVNDIDLKYSSTGSEVTILRNTYGMNNVIPKIYPINSGGGVPIDISPTGKGIEYNEVKKEATAYLNIEYSQGDYYPFVIGEKVMIEGSNPGIGNSRGFNSSEFNYNLYTITAIDPNFGGSGGSVSFSMEDQLQIDEGVIEFDKINSAPRILPQREFPTFNVTIKRNEFIPEEVVKSGSNVGFVEDWDNEFGILKINSTDEFVANQNISGVTSKSIGFLEENIFPFKDYGKYGSTIQQDKGWKEISGFLNNDLQRIPDNDYYQNFSYSLKSTVPLQVWNDPVSSMNHVTGYKKFANYQLESYEKGLNIQTSPTEGSTYVNLIKDIVETVDLNCVNDFDLVRENYIDIGDSLISTQIIFDSRLISDFDEAVSNRVLRIDDISQQFDHRPRTEEFKDIDTFDLDKVRFLKYITLVRDKRFTSERQVSIFDVIHDGTYGYSNEYGIVGTTTQDLGSFDFAIALSQGLIRFYPSDTKIAYNDFNISYIAYKIEDEFTGIGSSVFGDVALVSTSSTEFSTVGTPVNIVSIASTYNSISVMVTINPDVSDENEEFAFTQMNFVHNGNTIISSDEIAPLYTTFVNDDSSNVGYGTFHPYISGSNFMVDFTPNAGIGTTAVINTIQIGIAQTATTSEFGYNMNHARLQVESHNISASSSPGITTVNSYRYIESSEQFHASKYWVHVADKTNNEHEFVELFVVDTINGVGVTSEAYLTEWGNLQTSSGLGTFGAAVDDTGFGLELRFTPEPNIDVEVNIFANHLKSETADEVDTIIDFNNGLITDDRDDYVGTFNDVKTEFDLTHEGQDIFQFWFSPNSAINLTDNTIRLPNHFFTSGERVSYYRNDVNDVDSAIGVASTHFDNVGIATRLPNGGDNIFIAKIDDNFIGLTTSAADAQLSNPSLIDITTVGTGSSHRFVTTRQNARVLITLDNIIQSPIVSTAITSAVHINVLSTDDVINFVGVTSFFGGDFIKINDEIMKIEGIGVGGSSTKVRVRRARFATKFANHSAGSEIIKISGNYNINDNTISFAEAPYGPDPVENLEDPNELDWQGVAKGSYFSGRSYMRGKIPSGTSETYSNNHVFQDVSNRFNALENTFPLRTDAGTEITNMSDENAVILINSVFQLPGITVEEDYNITEVSGMTSAIFNGDARDLGRDVGISSFPTAGIIQSIGSTEGFGYHPLVAAAGTVTVSSSGTVTAVSVGDTGLGYRCEPYFQIVTKTSYPISSGTTNIFVENENSVFGILNEVYDGTNVAIGIGSFRIENSTMLNGIGNTFVQLRPNQVSLLDIPVGTPVSIGVTLPYGIVNVSAATSSISPGATPGLTYDVLNASYNPESGFLTMTLPKSHELQQGDYIRIVDNSLHFTCTSDNNTKLKSYPRPGLDTRASQKSLRLENVVDQDVTTFVGLSTFQYFNVSNAVYTPVTGITTLTIGANHGLVVGRGISIETDSLSFKCAMDGNTATKTYPRSTDPAANNTLDITAVDQTAGTITVNVGASPLVNHQVSAATYNPTTGVLELTIGSHTLTTGTSVRLGDNSLTFTCAQDSHGSNHTYPRNGDPAYQTAVNITAVSATTITLNVGTSSNTTAHTFVSAAANAVVSGGNYAHTFQSATANAVRAGGQYTHTFVGIGTDAVVSAASTSIQHIGFATVITGTGHISPNVNITNPGFELNIDQEGMPLVIFDDPIPYGNIPLVYSNENTIIGLGTQSRIDVEVGNGSSITAFNFTNNGYAYGSKDILTVLTGGLTGIPTYISSDFKEFQITIDRTFDDTFNGWSVGELEVLDNNDQYIDGKRLLFPLFRNGERLSIISAKGSKIDPAQLLLVFVNNVLQVPGESYVFFGGNRIRFTEAPRVGDFLRILYYKGNGAGFDVIPTEVVQTVKEGDTLDIESDDAIFDEDKRTVTDILSTDTVETLPYFGPGNTDNVELTRPVDWCRQTEDKIINGRGISKARTFYEPNIVPNATLIKNVAIGNTVLYVDTTRPLFNQNNENDSTLLFQNNIIIHPGGEKVGATATATVSTAGTVTGFTITNGGLGYIATPNVSVASTNGVSGIGTITTARGLATLTNGVVTGIAVSEGGVGYAATSPPSVLISPPEAQKLEKTEVYFPDGYRGDSGSIVGFATTAIGSDTFALFDLYIPQQDNVFNQSFFVGFAITTSQIAVGDVFTIYNSNIGSATTAITSYDGAGAVLGISTSYIDGVYEVLEAVTEPRNVGGIGTATVRVRSKVANAPLGFDFDTNSGMTTSMYQGSYSWGKIILKSGSANAYTAHNQQGIGGISTSPTILRTEPLKFVRYDEYAP